MSRNGRHAWRFGIAVVIALLSFNHARAENVAVARHAVAGLAEAIGMSEPKIADLKNMAEQIQRLTLTIEANANEEGHLYGSVGAPEIVKALKAQNLVVESEMVRLEGPIRECALYAVKIHLGYEIDGEVKVLVVRLQEKK